VQYPYLYGRQLHQRSVLSCHAVPLPDVYPGHVAQDGDRGRARSASEAGRKGGSDDFVLRLPARAEELRTVRHALEAWLVGQGAPPEVAADLTLAAHEAAANVVEHAYPNGGDVIVRARRDDGSLLVVVQDKGHWRAPSRTDQRGRGLTVMRRLVDDVEIAPLASGTTVFLRRLMTPA
jgi:serine/threonine-protein kinase RsbW